MTEENSTERIERLFEKAANVIIFLMMLGLIVLFVYLLSRYSLIKPMSRALVFALPLIGMGAWLVFYRWPAWKIPLALTVVSIVVPIYIFELSLWQWYLSFAFGGYRDKVIAQDNRLDMEVLHDLQAQGQDATIYIALPSLMGLEQLRRVFPMHINGKEVIPLSAESVKTTVLCKGTDSWITYQSDEYGFNNPRGLYKPGKVDIAVLGGSYAQGFCVPPQSNIPALLRKVYPHTINLGAGGTGALAYYAIFREYAEALRPKIVLYIYAKNTLARIDFEEKLKIYLNKGFEQHLSLLQPQLDEGYSMVVRKMQDYWQSNKKGYQIEAQPWVQILTLKKTREQIGVFLHDLKGNSMKKETRDDFIGIFQRTLQDTKTSTQSWGGQVVFVYIDLPFADSFSDHNEILSAVKPLSIPIIDLYGMFNDVKDPDQIYTRSTGHLNEYGYSRVVDEIIKGLKGLHATP